jgi:hypothetical protein
MSARRWLVIIAVLMIGVIMVTKVLSNQWFERQRRGRVRDFAAHLEQHVDPESLRRWAENLISSGEGREGFRATNAPESIAMVYGFAPWARAWDGVSSNRTHVMLSAGRAQPYWLGRQILHLNRPMRWRGGKVFIFCLRSSWGAEGGRGDALHGGGLQI